MLNENFSNCIKEVQEKSLPSKDNIIGKKILSMSIFFQNDWVIKVK